MFDLIPGPWKLAILGVLLAMLAGSAWALKRQIAENGKLEATIEQRDRDIKSRDDLILAWRTAAEDKAKLETKFGEIATGLSEIKTVNAKTRTDFQRGIKDVLEHDDEAKRVMDTRAPADVVRVQCDAGSYSARAAAELCGGAAAEQPVPEAGRAETGR